MPAFTAKITEKWAYRKGKCENQFFIKNDFWVDLMYEWVVKNGGISINVEIKQAQKQIVF